MVDLKKYVVMDDEKSTVEDAKKLDDVYNKNPEAFWETMKEKYGDEIKTFYDSKVKEQENNI